MPAERCGKEAVIDVQGQNRERNIQFPCRATAEPDITLQVFYHAGAN